MQEPTKAEGEVEQSEETVQHTKREFRIGGSGAGCLKLDSRVSKRFSCQEAKGEW